MSISVDPDDTAHHEPSHLDLRCLHKNVIIACGSERVKEIKIKYFDTHLVFVILELTNKTQNM